MLRLTDNCGYTTNTNTQEHHTFARWCGALSQLLPDEEAGGAYDEDELDIEREDAFSGLCQCVRAAPQMVLQGSNAGHLFLALLKFPDASPALTQEFVLIMVSLIE
jgi:hypothetical protein